MNTQESNVINRVLKAHGMPTLDEPGVVAALAYQVEDHLHFTELLRACEPQLRRQMYEAMSPYLRFRAKPLEDYIIAAKEHAAAAELPTMDEQGFLHPYSAPTVTLIEIPQVELFAQCSRCEKGAIFFGARKVDAIHNMRSAGWAWDESAQASHLCAECLEEIPDAMDSETGQETTGRQIAPDSRTEAEDAGRAREEPLSGARREGLESSQET